jgi:uncharacterized protein YifE (UPF0438 family)
MTSTEPPRLIAPYIKALQELDRGVRVPRTNAQVHFVEVCRGGAQPTTAYERAYLAWREKEQRFLNHEGPARPRKLHGKRERETNVTPAKPRPGRWSDPKPYARFVDEPLGTREDFKRDRGANFAAARRDKL